MLVIQSIPAKNKCWSAVILLQLIDQRMIDTAVSDIEFYEGKIKSLQQDNFYMHEEIIKLRTRLRTAEDFQIKYSLLVSSNQKQMERLRNNMERQEQTRLKELLSAKMQESDQHWAAKIKEFQANLRNEAELTIEKLRKQLNEKNEQISTMKDKNEEAELFGFKLSKLQKQNQNLRTQIEEIKGFHEKKRTQQIAKLRTALNTNYRQRIQTQQKKYQSKIIDLQNKLHELQLKDDNTTYKVSDTTNKELSALKILMDEKAKEFAKELQQSRELCRLKNDEISKILKEHMAIDGKYRQQMDEKNEYIKQLEDKLLEREKMHEMELLNQIERTRLVKDQQKQELLDQITHLNSEITRFQQLWNEKILNHQSEIEELNNKFEEEKRRLVQDKNMNKRKISELSLRIKEADGQREIGETEMLINSLRDIDIKGDQLGNYQNGITFLERLNKKCQLKLEEKSRTVSKLYKDINDIRTEADREISELKEKLRKDRKQNTQKIQTLQNEVRDLTDKLKIREKQSRKRQRQFLKEKTQLEEKSAALKELNEQLQRDYSRAIEGKKDAETSFREERQKSFASRSDLNLIKKQKWLELEKQKNELHIIFKEKEEQLKLQYEQPIDDLKSQLNKLKQDHEITKKQNEQLKKENQQFWQQMEMNKENDKMVEYNKKMASLNLELALTQNIYESLKKAKSRVDHASFSPAEFCADVDAKSFAASSQSESPLMMSFHPSATAIK